MLDKVIISLHKLFFKFVIVLFSNHIELNISHVYRFWLRLYWYYLLNLYCLNNYLFLWFS